MRLWTGSNRGIYAVRIRFHACNIEISKKILILVDDDFFIMSAWKEHSVYFVVIWTVNIYMCAFKSLLEDQLCLIKSSKNYLTNLKIAASADTLSYQLIEIFIKLF